MTDDTLQRTQARFLKELFYGGKGGFVLKGGMAMMALFGPARLTRDVDLDFPELRQRTADSLHNQVMRALKAALQGSGVQQAKISEPGKAEISPKWKVSGTTAHGEPFHMKVEVSRRPPPPGAVRQATVSGVSAFGLGTYYVDLYDEKTLVAMKLAALLGRTAARDVTDLDLLLPKHRPTGVLIAWALAHAQVDASDASGAVGEKLASMSYDFFKTEMLADAELLARIEETEWEAMRARVRHALSDLLDDHALQGELS
jgi:predicted nucleotidyltransferase component of viral defense system